MKFNINKEVAKLLKKPFELQAKMEKLIDPQKLTTPPEITQAIQAFCTKLNPDISPFFIEISPEPWCRQSCCDMNVNEYIKANGGEIICGYKIWYNDEPIYLEAERHAIWSDGKNNRDLTFNSDGEEKILFIPDVQGKTKNLEDNEPRIRWAPHNKIRAIIRAFETIESQMPIERMSNEESWKTMPTFEEWQKGKRMPSMFLKNIG